MTSEKLESKGQNLYILSKIFMFIGLCGIVLALLIGVISIACDGEFVSPFIFDMDDDFAFAYPFVVINYLAFLLGLAGIPMYFASLNIYALGRIAHNTEK